ncbi:MAG: hypothetical protein A3E85_04335 [Gammaproteobacteria bacterium RIFCSPHIGHO2_12_FULL_45_12]|nr:MAG: hypothetical protein A3E85_04335 [Gammaproteobacteria bacterium RIFCSPHIGHO2_12_FULL_45_12]
MDTSTLQHKKVKLECLNAEERRAHAKETYAQKSYFQTLFNADEVNLSCKEHALQFQAEINRLVTEKNILPTIVSLESMHQYIGDELTAYDFTHGVNKLSSYFYQTDDHFKKVYHQFIRFLRNEIVKEPFLFQATPTIRLHCPKAINANLYPRYHSDIFYGHPPEEFNIWIPLTPKLGGHGFSIMSVDESKTELNKFNYDFAEFVGSATHDRSFSAHCESVAHAVEANLGEMFLFDSRCIHSGEPLKEHTRVSIDIRLLPLSQYQKMTVEYRGTGRLKILFELGHCYHELNSDQL